MTQPPTDTERLVEELRRMGSSVVVNGARRIRDKTLSTEGALLHKAADALTSQAGEIERLRAKGETLLAALRVNGYPVSDAHWRNASGGMSMQARALHLAATDFRDFLSPPIAGGQS